MGVEAYQGLGNEKSIKKNPNKDSHEDAQLLCIFIVSLHQRASMPFGIQRHKTIMLVSINGNTKRIFDDSV